MAGKGSDRRPSEVAQSTYNANYDSIFSKKQKEDKKTTEEPTKKK